MNVGLVMRVKREWFDAVPLCVAQEIAWPDVKRKLQEQFTFPQPARKTLQILRTTWYDNADYPPDLHRRGASVWLAHDSTARSIIHTLLVLKAFPTAREVVALIAHELRFKDSVSVKQLSTQVKRRFGEDSSLNEALPKITASLAELGLVVKEAHTISRRATDIHHPEVVSWCFECMIEILGREPQSRKALEQPEFLLGHRLHLNHETIAASAEHLELYISGSREQMIAIR